tara:strand:+ start:37 stop:267 length:231 start_codon:yes stop_codon:yes gene_type:complete
MGRAINQDNKIDELDRRLKLVEDALEETIQTKIHHIDLTGERSVIAEGVEVKPDEVIVSPTSKRKKTTRKKIAAVE